MHLAHQKGDAIRLGGFQSLLLLIHLRMIEATNDLLLRSLPARLIITDAIPRHIDTHIRRRLVRGLPHHAFQKLFQNRENIRVTVIGHHLLTVGSQDMGVNMAGVEVARWSAPRI